MRVLLRNLCMHGTHPMGQIVVLSAWDSEFSCSIDGSLLLRVSDWLIRHL